jgi:hypothetical protein
MRREYMRTAFQPRVEQQLRIGLRRLEQYCWQPCRPPLLSRQQTPNGDLDELHQAMRQLKTWWPPWDLLNGLTQAVITLANLELKRPHLSTWKAFKRVDRLRSGFRLIHRIDNLVQRAENRLSEAGQSDLSKLRRIADGAEEPSLRAKRFLADLQKVQADPTAAAKIDWASHHLVLKRRTNKDCYIRALQIIAAHQALQPLRREALPLLTWIAGLGNPAYEHVLKWDQHAEWLKQIAESGAAQKRAAKRKQQQTERVRRFRSKKTSQKSVTRTKGS